MPTNEFQPQPNPLDRRKMKDWVLEHDSRAKKLSLVFPKRGDLLYGEAWQRPYDNRGQLLDKDVLKTIYAENPGGTLTAVVGHLTAAQSAEEVYNAFFILNSLRTLATSPEEITQYNRAVNEFLLDHARSPTSSSGAKKLAQKIAGDYGQAKSGVLDIPFDYLKNHYSRTLIKFDDVGCFLEAYLSIILDGNYEMELRAGLLKNAALLELGDNANLLSIDRRLDPKATFWDNVQPGWIYPGYKPEAQSTPSRHEHHSTPVRPPEARSENMMQEIEALRRELAQAQRAKQDLQRQNDALRGELAQNALKLAGAQAEINGLRLQARNLGATPLDILAIDPEEWNGAGTQEQKRQLLKERHRQAAKIMHTDAKPDLGKGEKQVYNRYFNMIMKAKQYLEECIEQGLEP